MTTRPAPREISTPEQLRDVLGEDFTFSDQQFAAITAPLAPGVIIAGAGSGKTAVMAARVVWLVVTGRVDPGQVLGLTFTTKATAELARRIRASLHAAGWAPRALSGDDESPDLEEPTVATYHSYAAGLLTEQGLRIGHEPDTRLITEASRYQLAARAIQRHTQQVQFLSDAPRVVIPYLLALDAELSEHLVDIATLRAYDAEQRARFLAGIKDETRSTYREGNIKAVSAIDRRAELLDLIETYRQLKAELGLMDFSDQISLAARLVAECPEVGESERQKFRVVLLDEYQDTSVAQAVMLRRLFSGPDAEHGLGHPVTAVGDPHQAIYGWRGASVSNILDFAEHFPTAAGRADTFSLTVNRRSDARILSAANHLAAELYDLRPELLPLEPAPGAAPGEVRVAVHDTDQDELAWLAEQVLATHTQLAAHTDKPCWREIGVLTRDNKHAAEVFDALTAREIPVEIVGLKGLLRLPEVAEVVATLTLVHDVTANAALLTLLAGPRWAIGARDLALLGQRARALAGTPGGGETYADVAEHLRAAVQGADPTEIASLCDALADPGDLAYSAEARDRFGLLAAELRRLRASVGEPLLDLVRRIIDTTGIDVELASSVSPAAAARRENLDLFVQAVADFRAIDGQVTLAALLAWLEAEDDFGQGLDVATPSEADSVKLLTVHRAKGLEWDAVFVVGVTDSRFPHGRSRSTALTVPQVLPVALRGDAADLPALTGHAPADLTQYLAAVKAHQQLEELRLGYVAWTRARHQLTVSAWCWSAQLKKPRGPSAYLHRTHEVLQTWGEQPLRWREAPEAGEPHAFANGSSDLPWPISHQTAETERRREAARRVAAVDPDAVEEFDDPVLREQVRQWDDELARLVAEAQREHSTDVVVALPSSVSATSMARLRDDAAGFARDLARPMPRPPSSAARFGTRFHAWVEARFGQQQLLDPDELPGRGDAGIEDDEDLRQLIATFESGPFADRVPEAVEPAFALVLAGQVVRGRIDAVYAEPADPDPASASARESASARYLVVDWKTNRAATADPLQLALYRLAWAELRGVPVSQVRAAFYYVRTGEVVEPTDLPDRAELEQLVLPPAPVGH